MLWMRMRRGDGEAVAAIVRRYAHSLYRFIYQQVRNEADAEDILQETWVRMIRGLERFNPKYPFSSWLFQIALNLCRDLGRARAVRQRAVPLLAEQEEEARTRSGTPEQAVIATERRDRLAALLDALSPKQREVVLLRCLYGYSEQEVARIVRAPRGTVKSRLHHAIRKLRSLLEKFHAEEGRSLRKG